MVITLISLNANPEHQGTALGLNASYLNVSNAFGPVIAGLIIHQSDPHTYAYPLYLAGILTFVVFLFAMIKQEEYTPRSHSA
jgi:predicted MFS family arabinose efflux permease